jgi:hypothetical protein
MAAYKWLLGALLAVSLSFCAAPGWAQGEGKTLREVLASEKLPLDAEKLPNLEKVITSGAELNDAARFVIAYYVRGSTEQLNPPIFIDSYDRRAGQWSSGSIAAAAAKWEGSDVDCLGSVMQVEAFSDVLVIETHINPSAGCELVLSPDFKLKTSLYGWTLGHFEDGSIIYHRSEVHFATVHPSEIAFYDAASGKDYTIFPRKPFQQVRLGLIEQLGEFFKTHQDYCQKADDPCDPEEFDSDIKGKIAVNDREHAIAFVVSYALQGYGQGKEKPSGPSEVVYVYRNVNDEEKMEYREMLWEEVRARAGDVPFERLVEPEILDKIFAAEPAKKEPGGSSAT